MSMSDPAVKTVITKKSATKVFVERFWDGDVIKSSSTHIEMPDALDDKTVGDKITLEEYETAEHTQDGTAIWYYPNGNKYKEYEYKDGWLQGSYKIWWEDGEKNTVGERSTTWKDDRTPSPVHIEGDNVERRVGTWKYYDEEGTETETIWSE
jgi:antitoxin component YwqK of YwqJK toxin-antitoxin module